MIFNYLKKGLLYIFIFLLNSQVYSYEKENISNEIKKLIEYESKIEDSIKSFYASSFYQPYWQNDKTKINDLLTILSQTYREGIPITRYEIELIKELQSSKKISDKAKLELLLTEKFILHSKDLKLGIVNPVKLSSFIDIKREELNTENLLNYLTNECQNLIN